MIRRPTTKPPSPARLAKLREGDRAAERDLLNRVMAQLDAGHINMNEARRLFREGTGTGKVDVSV